MNFTYHEYVSITAYHKHVFDAEEQEKIFF